MYENGIYTDAGGCGEQPEVGGHSLFPDVVAEVTAHVHHVHGQQTALHLSQEGDADAEDRPPAVHQEHVEDARQLVVGEEAGEHGHNPFRGEIVRGQLDLAEVGEKLRHMEFDELGHLEILQM